MKASVRILLLVFVLLAGCEEVVETHVPVEAEVAVEPVPAAEASEVEKIVPTELQVIVGEYEVAVRQKLAELDVLKKKVKEIPVEKIVNEQAEVIKGAMEDVADSLSEMMEELAGHLEELTESGDGQ